MQHPPEFSDRAFRPRHSLDLTWIIPLGAAGVFLFLFGWFCLDVWPRDVPTLDWRAATLGLLALAAVVGVAFEDVTKDLGRDYSKAPAVDRLTPASTAARYLVKVAVFGLCSLVAATALNKAARRTRRSRAAPVVIALAAVAVTAAATRALLSAHLGKSDGPARVGSDYVSYCELKPAEAYCARVGPPLSDYGRPFGEFTPLVGLTLAIGVGIPRNSSM